MIPFSLNRRAAIRHFGIAAAGPMTDTSSPIPGENPGSFRNGRYRTSRCGRKCPVSSSGYGTPVPILLPAATGRGIQEQDVFQEPAEKTHIAQSRSRTDTRELPREVARSGCIMAPSLRRLLHFHRTSCHYVLLITRRSGESGRMMTDRLNRFIRSGSFSVIGIRLVPASGISADSRFRPG